MKAETNIPSTQPDSGRQTTTENPAPAEVGDRVPQRARHRHREILVQLVTITSGVLIALFFDGLVAWNQDRQLVNQARTTIRREIADNLKELDGMLTSTDGRRRDLQQGLRLANELLFTGKSAVNEFKVTRQLAELNASGWHTAERTGALAHMAYDEVQRYSRLYALQEIFSAHERRFIERVSAIGGIVAGGDPRKAPREDLQALRGHLLALHGDLKVEEDLGQTLRQAYLAELKQ
jgi:hypothetical protein